MASTPSSPAVVPPDRSEFLPDRHRLLAVAIARAAVPDRERHWHADRPARAGPRALGPCERPREQHAVRAGRRYSPVASTACAARGCARSVPNPCAVRSSAALRRVGSATMLPAPQAVTKRGSESQRQRVARRLLHRRLEQVGIRVDADVRVDCFSMSWKTGCRSACRSDFHIQMLTGAAGLPHREERRVGRERELDGGARRGNPAAGSRSRRARCPPT